ncbi:hypothetical protein [Segnochrobactrum spirostomi]|uniref:LPXTG cell wall anchor domain-containing protein n=1 Tax=Segnochrobactrum spirostomi TaxID=2608987 RepID=A0A6A7Y907_9HYPH|nr:hypothetical protein [Segnochrobactrum spirostomi]MQT15215.1 hypothetical protein [Segnochrobactrum spirostomi]
MSRFLLVFAVLASLAGAAVAQPTDTTPSTSAPSRNGDVTAPQPSTGTGNGQDMTPSGTNQAGPAEQTIPQQRTGGATIILWPAIGALILIVGGLLVYYSMRRQRLDPRTQRAHDYATREVFKQDGEGPTGRTGGS